MNADL